MKTIQLPGQVADSGRFPLVCAPLVARDAQALLDEAAAVAAKGPDLLEWRVDFFEGIADTAEVVGLAARIRQAAAGLPLLFTRRSTREGGEPIALTEPQVVDLYRAVCAGGQVALVDFEMGNDPAHVQAVRACSRRAGIGLILSFHDFQRTPPVDALVARFAQAAQLGADVAKVAVMPRGMQDVLALLEATRQASEQLPIPVVSMAMGGPGALTRLCGFAFGSAMTFGIGLGSSAPGQLPIADLQAGLAMLRRAGAP